MIDLIDRAREQGDTLGGIFEIRAYGLPAGLGSYVHWDRRLDGRLAAALMSIQAVKGVEIGEGFAGAARPGSQVRTNFIKNMGFYVPPIMRRSLRVVTNMVKTWLYCSHEAYSDP